LLFRSKVLEPHRWLMPVHNEQASGHAKMHDHPQPGVQLEEQVFAPPLSACDRCPRQRGDRIDSALAIQDARERLADMQAFYSAPHYEFVADPPDRLYFW